MELITINTTNPAYSNTIGQRVDLSYIDIKKVNYVYCKSNKFILFELNSIINYKY
jgi:hypothetical protein